MKKTAKKTSLAKKQKVLKVLEPCSETMRGACRAGKPGPKATPC